MNIHIESCRIERDEASALREDHTILGIFAGDGYQIVVAGNFDTHKIVSWIEPTDGPYIALSRINEYDANIYSFSGVPANRVIRIALGEAARAVTPDYLSEHY